MSEMRDLKCRIAELEARLKNAETTTRRDEIRIKKLENDLATVGEVLRQMQPVLGRVVAIVAVLQKRGEISEADLKQITHKEAEGLFAQTAPVGLSD